MGFVEKQIKLIFIYPFPMTVWGIPQLENKNNAYPQMKHKHRIGEAL